MSDNNIVQDGHLSTPSVTVNHNDATKTSATPLSPISEIKNYKMYTDMVSFLNILHFPLSVLQQIPVVKQTYDSLVSQVNADMKGLTINNNAAGYTDIYKTRIPFWVLLEDPWSIIDPLMTADTEYVSKLAPMCTFLHIDKDEFHSRAIMSSYPRVVGEYMDLYAFIYI